MTNFFPVVTDQNQRLRLQSNNNTVALSRRHFVLGASSSLALTTLPFSLSLSAGSLPISNSPSVLSGNSFDLQIGYQKVNFTGKERLATTVNGSMPGPILRWKEGERVTLRVTNNLKEDSSIHWHGIILPSNMDGSPGFDFAGIKPGETYEYQFDVKQNGTYWYHSHSGLQEQTGLIGSIIIEPKDPDPVAYDREMVVILSDWTDENPQKVYTKLKKMSHYYNFRERTLADTWRDVKTKGVAETWKDRKMWNQMRMSETDLSDVTGYTYTYLMNGVTPDRGWLGVCKPGEKVRLRIINGAAMSIFDVRVPGLKMTVVAADGQNIRPVVVDEFRIAVAETYDVIVEPQPDHAYTLFAQSIDRTGYARGTLTTNPALQAEVPAMDPAPLLGHGEMGMGMDHSGHDMGAMDSTKMDTAAVNHSGHAVEKAAVSSRTDKVHREHDMNNMDGMDEPKMDKSSMDHRGHDMSKMDGMDKSKADMSGMDHSSHDMKKMEMQAKPATDHSGHDMSKMVRMDKSETDMSGMDHSGHDKKKMDEATKPATEHSGHDMSKMDGMDKSKMDMSGNDHGGHDMKKTHSAMDHTGHDMSQMGRTNMSSLERVANTTKPLAKAGFGSNFDNTTPPVHVSTEFGPHVDSRSMMPASGLGDPGIGLRNNGRRVLTYADLRGLHPTRDKREPTWDPLESTCRHASLSIL